MKNGNNILGKVYCLKCKHDEDYKLECNTFSHPFHFEPLKSADVMDGIFVSLVMNGPSTKILIRQFDGVKYDNGMMLSTTDFASLMFQLKAIEHSFLLGERKEEFTTALETVDKSTETDAGQQEKQAVSRVGTKGELHERLKNAPKKRELMTETLK